jgi:hypothetical protein
MIVDQYPSKRAYASPEAIEGKEAPHPSKAVSDVESRVTQFPSKWEETLYL